MANKTVNLIIYKHLETGAVIVTTPGLEKETIKEALKVNLPTNKRITNEVIIRYYDKIEVYGPCVELTTDIDMMF